MLTRRSGTDDRDRYAAVLFDVALDLLYVAFSWVVIEGAAAEAHRSWSEALTFLNASVVPFVLALTSLSEIVEGLVRDRGRSEERAGLIELDVIDSGLVGDDGSPDTTTTGGGGGGEK